MQGGALYTIGGKALFDGLAGFAVFDVLEVFGGAGGREPLKPQKV